MAEFKKNILELNHRFDRRTGRHSINNFQSVFHCHHYTTLTTQLALDAGEYDLLENTAEDAFYDVIAWYYTEKGITNLADKLDIACQYYSAIGLGTLQVAFIGDDSGKVISENSHIEQGWVKKWGKYDKPVNYIGRGYIRAMFSAVLNRPTKSFNVKETKSIVMGDAATIFTVVKK